MLNKMNERGTAMDATVVDPERIHTLSEEEAWKLFDTAARRYLGISGEEFLRSWEQGKYEGLDEPRLMHVIMLLPLVEK